MKLLTKNAKRHHGSHFQESTVHTGKTSCSSSQRGLLLVFLSKNKREQFKLGDTGRGEVAGREGTERSQGVELSAAVIKRSEGGGVPI